MRSRLFGITVAVHTDKRVLSLNERCCKHTLGQHDQHLNSRQDQAVRIENIQLRDVRNIQQADVQPSPDTNVLFGDNGQGKTSFLEAIYWVMTSKSFRTPRVRELIRQGSSGCSVLACVRDRGLIREQQVGMTQTHRIVKENGKVASKLADYAAKTPIVVFHPGELNLTMGPASARRTLIDRIALFVNPEGHQCHYAYKAAMKARQTLLKQQGSQAKGLDAYESVMMHQAVRIMHRRETVCHQLNQTVKQAFDELAPQNMRLQLRYQPAASADYNEGVERLAQMRNQDAARGSANYGPHRDDLLLLLNEQNVRANASQGQHRLLTLSLKLGEMACVEHSRGVRPLLLLDDVSSELDSKRTQAFFGLLSHCRDQVFLTTTRPDMLPIYEKSIGVGGLWNVSAGVIAPG